MAAGTNDGGVLVHDMRKLTGDPITRLHFSTGQHPVLEVCWQRHTTLKKSQAPGRPGGRPSGVGLGVGESNGQPLYKVTGNHKPFGIWHSQ